MERSQGPAGHAGRPAQRIGRVLMTADTIGGIWPYALELAEALAEHRIDLGLATMGRLLDGPQREAVKRLTNVDVYESRYRLEWMDDPWADVEAAGEWLLDLESRVAPDLVHLNGYVHADLPWRAPVLIVGHSCVCSWYERVRGGEPPADWGRYRAAVARGLGAATLVTAPTRDMLGTLQRLYGGFRSWRPIPNGRRASRFPPGRKYAFAMAAGRLWDEAKNIAALEEIAADLPWPIFVAGDAKGPNSAGGRVTLRRTTPLGVLSQYELANWLGRASLFILPARYEPFGLCALEAALAGCTLVLGDIPSLREVWGEAAVYVPPDRPGELRDVLRRLMGDEAARRALARRSKHRALAYSPERMAAGYTAAYRAAAARAHGGARRGAGSISEPGPPGRPDKTAARTWAGES